jgi:hypothetical protein
LRPVQQYTTTRLISATPLRSMHVAASRLRLAIVDSHSAVSIHSPSLRPNPLFHLPSLPPAVRPPRGWRSSVNTRSLSPILAHRTVRRRDASRAWNLFLHDSPHRSAASHPHSAASRVILSPKAKDLPTRHSGKRRGEVLRLRAQIDSGDSRTARKKLGGR